MSTDDPGTGEALWAAITTEWNLTPEETAWLSQAAHTLDEIVLLEQALDGDDVIVSGSMGQPVPNPLLGELRRHRQLLDRLLTRLPDVAAGRAEKVAVAQQAGGRTGGSRSDRGAALRAVWAQRTGGT